VAELGYFKGSPGKLWKGGDDPRYNTSFTDTPRIPTNYDDTHLVLGSY